MIVKYSNGITITNKNKLNLSIKDTTNAPTVNFENLLKKDKKYILIMYDPNAPNVNHNYVHWIIINIQNDITFDTLLAYTGPAPPAGSGVHRYIFKLYEQPNVILQDINIDNRDISISALLNELKLTNVKPISSVSFTCSSAIGGTRKRRKRRLRRSRKTRRKI